MSTYESLSHSKEDCKYPIVFVPEGRKVGHRNDFAGSKAGFERTMPALDIHGNGRIVSLTRFCTDD